jgi:acyl-CoA synthetase (NDP forming)
MPNPLDRLLSPKSIALIGASANPSKISNVVLRNLTKGDFTVYPVNPKESKIAGLDCYGSISEIPGPVDLALIALPARAAVKAASECIAKGVKFVAVTSSGFAESGPDGKVLQDELTSMFRSSGSRLLGPNTMGVFVPGLRLDTFLIPSERSPRPSAGTISLISQSGAVAVAFLEKAASFGTGVSACVCIGNRADVDENELLSYLADDPKTDCIAMYLESFSDGREFLKIAGKVSSKKPVVLLKSGRTSSGAKAAGSHTGAIAGSSDALVMGAIRQAGVVRAYDEEELLDLARALSYTGQVRGDRVCIVASAGGYGVIATDYVESADHGYGLRMAELSQLTQERLRSLIPQFSSNKNPVDLTAEVSDRMYDDVLRTLQADPGVDCILMSLELQPPNVTRGLIDIAVRRRTSGTPIVVTAFGGPHVQDSLRALEQGRVAYYPTLRRAVRGISALVERGRYTNR